VLASEICFLNEFSVLKPCVAMCASCVCNTSVYYGISSAFSVVVIGIINKMPVWLLTWNNNALKRCNSSSIRLQRIRKSPTLTQLINYFNKRKQKV